MDEAAISFGPFRLLPARRLLLEDERPVRLGSRAFDILAALVERVGEVVGKDELIARVWPTLFVEESNLKIQVSALRRALGDGQAGNRYIATVPGRGYEFVAPVRRAGEPRVPPSQKAATPDRHNLPVAVTRMIGREETVTALVSRLSHDRLVTLVGPGGIGKTTVALAVAEAVVAGYEHGVWLIDLAPLGDARLVPSAIATVLGLQIHAEDPLPGLIAGLRDKRMLLVLDNCEHVIEATASLAAALLRGAAGIAILATSREPLGVEGEREYRLRLLPSPPPSPRLTAADAMAFPAVQLFAERAAALVEDFVLSDSEAPAAVEICHKLDGLPLAIEFAAARVEVLGVRGVAAHLGNGLQLLRARRRVAIPRHGTMQAALDWSYRLLTEDEQQFFRRLAIFTGSFGADAAASVAADTSKAKVAPIDLLADLVTKSLVTADITGSAPRFRLLDTTRAYALEKLGESGERERLARRHAEYYRDLFERAEIESETRPRAEWLADYGPRIDNLRAALDWAFSPAGDLSVGVALTAAAVPLWMHLSLVDECRSRVEQALAALGAGASLEARSEIRLRAALGVSLMYTRGPVDPETGAAWTTALKVAEDLEDVEYQLCSLWGLWVFHSNSSGHRVALGLAERFCTLAANRPDPNDRLIGARIIGTSQHYLGDLPSARRHLECVLTDYVNSNYSYIIRFQFDPRVTARVFLARILWLQGFPDQAMRTVESSIEDARAADHVTSLCYALSLAACPIALLVGDLTAAERYAGSLLDHSTRHALAVWHAFGLSHQGVLAIKRGDLNIGLQLLRAALDEFGETRWVFNYTDVQATLARALGDAGQVAEGLAVIEEALAWIERTEGRWPIAEFLRVKGELLLLQAAEGSAAAAEELFRQALDWAHRQGALSLELRGATSLARLLRDQGRSADAVALLQPVYDRFTEGFDTADLKTAKALIDSLR